MKQPIFVMERWQSHHENKVEFNLAESGVQPITLAELQDMAGVDPIDTLLSYGHTDGSPMLRERIAAMYPGADAANVVATVGSAEAAFVRIRESRPDLVLLDIVMPGQNGYEALLELARNKDTRDIPVIVCSSKTQAADVHYVTEKLGARSYIMKPVQRDELVSKIARIAPA